jgi:plasmid stabilization system protein ParE
MRIRWTAEARSDLVRLHEFLAAANRQAAAKAVQSLRAAPARLRDHPRLGPRLLEFAPREVRRLIVGDYELRYEIVGDTTIVLNPWHTREDRWPSVR